MKTISNEQLTIQVSPHGSELCSIFAFCLEIGYRIHGKQIEVIWRVKNTGEKEMSNWRITNNIQTMPELKVAAGFTSDSYSHLILIYKT